MHSDLKKWAVWVIIPLIFGVLLYWLARPPETAPFIIWLKLPAPPLDISSFIPACVLAPFPSFVWTFSLTSALLLIWKPSSIKGNILLSSIALLSSVSFEWLQKIQVVAGTFDRLDILFSLLASLLSAIFFRKN